MLVSTLLVISSIVLQTEATNVKVTKADIRDAMLALVRQEQSLEDKLLRHEHRERNLGEEIKNMLITVERRSKLLDFTKTAMIKLEERLIKIESFLSSNEVTSEDQKQKAQDIPSIMDEIKHDIIQEIKTNKCEDAKNGQNILTSKVDNLSTTVQQFQKELLALKYIHQDAQKLNKQTSENLDKITLRLSKNEDILKECETKHEKYSDYSKIMLYNIDQVLGKQNNATEVLAEIKTISGKMKLLPEKQDILSLYNSNVKSLETLKTTINSNDVNSKKLLEDKSKAILESINNIQIPKSTVSKGLLIGIQTIVSTKIDKLTSSVQNIQKEISKLKDEQTNAQLIHKQTTEQVEKAKPHFNNVEDVLVKYESKLAKYNNTIEALPENIMQALDKKCDINKILAELKTNIHDLPVKNDLNILQNYTSKFIEYLQANITEEIDNTKNLIKDRNKYILAKINTIEITTPNISREDIKILSNKIDPLKMLIHDVQKELSKLKVEHKCSQNASTQANEHMENVKRRLNNNEKLLEKYENKLASYNDNIEILHQNDKAENGWYNNIIKVLEKQRIDIEDLLNQVRSVSEKMNKIPEKDDLNISKDETLKSLDNLKTNTNKYFSNSILLLEEKVKIILNKMNQINESIRTSGTSKANLNEFQTILSKEVGIMNESVQKLHKEILTLENQHDSSEKLKELANENMEQIRICLNNGQDLLNKYNVSLAKYDNKIGVLKLKNEAEAGCCANITQALKKQHSHIKETLDEIKNVSDKVEALPIKNNIETAHNQTLKLIEDINVNIKKQFQHSERIREHKVEKILQNIENLQENNTRSSQKISDLIDILIMNLATSHQALSDEVTSLGKLEKIMLQATDTAMDTKRRVIYSVERILLEIKETAKGQSKNISSTINERFDMCEDSILNDVNRIFKNLTFKLDDEQVRGRTAFEEQNRHIKEVLDEIKNVSDKVEALPINNNLEAAHNQTLKLIETINVDIKKQFQNSEKIREDEVEKILQNIENLQENNTQSSQKISDLIDILILDLATSHGALNDKVISLGKLEQVILQSADSIIDTKRRVGYGVERILLEIEKTANGQSKNVSSTINERFDIFEDSIFNDVNRNFKNLTLKLGDDNDQVWRQIGTIYQHMKENTNALRKLQNETDTYVNGSLNAMDSLKDKFGKVSDTTTEIDKSVNYLMGKLLLVSKEFNNIKNALEDALDEIKKSFGEVKDKIKTTTSNTAPNFIGEVNVDN